MASYFARGDSDGKRGKTASPKRSSGAGVGCSGSGGVTNSGGVKEWLDAVLKDMV